LQHVQPRKCIQIHEEYYFDESHLFDRKITSFVLRTFGTSIKDVSGDIIGEILKDKHEENFIYSSKCYKFTEKVLVLIILAESVAATNSVCRMFSTFSHVATASTLLSTPYRSVRTAIF
jgi:hypothetical protein